MAMVSQRRIPVWVKLLYSAFVAILVPLYWKTYGSWNFLYFCDVALLVTVPAIWIESPLLVSMQAIAIVAPQTLWVVDLICRVGAGLELTDVTAYMLDSSIPLYLRAFSLFHGWLPFFLLWLLWRLGYEQRALAFQSAAAIIILLVSYFFGPAPPPLPEDPSRAVNINFVYGLTDQHRQTFMPATLWLLCLMAINIRVFYIPTDFVLCRMFKPRSANPEM